MQAEPIMSANSASFWVRHRWTLLASVAVTFAFAWVLSAGALPVVPSRLEGVRWWTVVAYALIWSAVLVIRSVRWHWLLRPIHPVPMRRVVTVSLISLGALSLLPLRLGEVVRPAMIRQKGRVSGWAAMGTVAAERIIDGLFLSLVLFAALHLSKTVDPLPNRLGELELPVAAVPRAADAALILFLSAFLVMAVFYWYREWAEQVTRRIVGVVSEPFAARLASAVSRMADGFRFLPSSKDFVPFLLLTAVYWVLSILGLWLLVWGVGLPGGGTFASSCVIMGVLALGVLVPNAPGYFGAFQLSVYAALALYFPAEAVLTQGATFVFLLYLVQVGGTLLLSIGALMVEHMSPKDVLSDAMALDAEPAEVQ